MSWQENQRNDATKRRAVQERSLLVSPRTTSSLKGALRSLKNLHSCCEKCKNKSHCGSVSSLLKQIPY
uniref:Uncharacterized protein n=1 Tax=Manihot esculenta TaxID=3983 RepID=A0A2C9VJV2_MANES